MSPNIVLVVVAGVLIAAGVYLLLERSLSRILIGVLLASNGVNVLFLVVSGPAGGAPILGVTPVAEMSDPLPQALILTAIVITFGVAAFVLAHDRPQSPARASARLAGDASRRSGDHRREVQA